MSKSFFDSMKYIEKDIKIESYLSNNFDERNKQLNKTKEIIKKYQTSIKNNMGNRVFKNSTLNNTKKEIEIAFKMYVENLEKIGELKDNEIYNLSDSYGILGLFINDSEAKYINLKLSKKEYNNESKFKTIDENVNKEIKRILELEYDRYVKKKYFLNYIKDLKNKVDVKKNNNMLMNQPIISVEFKRSKSKNFQQALNIIKEFPNYTYDELNEKYLFNITEMKNYAKSCIKIERLIRLIDKWKSTIIILNGKKYEKIWDYYKFKDEIENKSGPYKIVLKSDKEVAVNSVIFEDLPFPLIYYPRLYGAFFGFSEDIEKKIYFCECERIGIESYIKLKKKNYDHNQNNLKNAPLGTDAFSEQIAIISQKDKNNPLSQFGFKEGICFRCNNKVSRLKFCNPMYGGLFKQKYGWYINQKYYELGMNKCLFAIDNIPMKEYSQKLYDAGLDKRISSCKEIKDEIENIVREELGFPRIGEYWTSEVVMFKIIEGLYPGYETIRHHRPEWLDGLELDMFIPKLKLAFEYQGIQHYEPIEHWGGMEQLKKQQKHDKKKKELCGRLGIDLITVDYDEELSTSYLKEKIKNLVGEKLPVEKF